MDAQIRVHVVRDILRLEEEPRPHGVEKLSARGSLYRIRVGPGKRYRAIYRIEDAVLVVIIVRVGDRKEVYR